MSPPTTPPADDSPDWVRDAARQFGGEVRLFLRTATTQLVHPVRFAERWVTGQQPALNPLGFLATAFAVLGPLMALLNSVVRHDSGAGSSPWLDALAALAPFGYYLLLGALQHGVLRLFGSRRRLRESCAMAMYAGGGAGLFAQLSIIALVFGTYVHFGVADLLVLHSRGARAIADVLMLTVLVLFGAFYVVLALSFYGLHRGHGVRLWQVIVAHAVAMAVAAFLFALLQPPGVFGPHFVYGPYYDRGLHAWRHVTALTL